MIDTRVRPVHVLNPETERALIAARSIRLPSPIMRTALYLSIWRAPSDIYNPNPDADHRWTALASTTSPTTLAALVRRGLITLPTGNDMVRGFAGEYLVDVTELGLAYAVQFLAD